LNINKCAEWNRRVGGIFFSKLINVHARLFGALEYVFDTCALTIPIAKNSVEGHILK
jgi:hypothetical protein